METTLNKIARKYMDILGAPADMPLPLFRVLHRPGARWLGRCWHRPFPTCTIELQRHMTQNPATLERIVAHEVVHHVLNLCHGLPMARYIGHGRLFLQAASRVNAAVCSDYVTVKNDADNSTMDHGKLPRPVVLMLYRHPEHPVPLVSWFSTATDRVRRVLTATSTRGAGHEVRLVPTDDGRWVNGIPKTSSCRYMVPTGELATRVEALWNQAQVVTIKP